jgi:hypothetical protein
MDVHNFEYAMVPVWPFIALWQVCVVLVVRSVWDRRAAIRRADARAGHMFYAGREEVLAGVLAAALSIPLLALWRVERSLWEASILFGPAGRNAFVEIDTGAQWLMLLQIILIHWLIVWFVYKWSLRRGLRKGTVVAASIDRCLSCGYESSAARCPECGTRRNDPKAIRPRVFIPWIEKRPWLRWIFRTRTSLIAIVFLFFAPVWVPAIRMGIAMVFP